ncbi:MAG: trigger factor [Metamycoplasmataceae bacterium]
MIKKTIDKKTSEMRILVPIPKEDWKNAQTKSFEVLAKKVSIKGFRKGKVPLAKAKELIDQSQIWEKAILSLLDKYVVIASKEIKDDEIILDHPTYTVEKVTSDELEIIFVYPLFPDFKLKDYKKTGISLDKPVTDEKLKKEVIEQEKNLLSKTAVLLPKEGKDAKVEKNDTIIFDFKGFLGKKAFEGGEAEDFELKVGSGNFIPGFEDKIIGLKLGESSIKVTFPKDYHVKDLANKNAEFKLNIKEIKAFDLPKLDEDFVKTLNIKDVTTPSQLRKYLLDLTKRENLEKARIKFKNEIFSRLLSQNEIPVPNTLMLKEVQMLSKKLEESLKKQGITKKEYLDLTKMTNNEITKELTVEAEKNIKTSLLFAHLAKIEKIEASDKDFEQQYEKLARVYNIEDVNMIKGMLPKEKLEPQIVNDLVIDMLIKYNSK